MSFHIIITSICLLLLLSHAGTAARARRAGGAATWWHFPAAMALCLPLAFGIIIPTSHYLFEFSVVSGSRYLNVLVFAVLGGAIWSAAGWRLVDCGRAGVRRTELNCLWIVWGILGFWYFLGVAITHREHGRTAELKDSGFYIAHLISLHAMILTVFIAWASGLGKGGGWFRRIAFGASGAMYLMMARLLVTGQA